MCRARPRSSTWRSTSSSGGSWSIRARFSPRGACFLPPSRGETRAVALAILDIDGTLVDTNYHHAVAWYRAFRQHGVVLPIWRIHRHIGMGGDQLVAALTDDSVESEKGDDIRAAEQPLYLAFIEEIEPMESARELISDLKDRGHTVVLASSAKEDEVDHYL